MLQPGATIGILGGGQLGRMVAMAAARLGFDAHIYTDEPDSPASRVAAATTVAAFDDEAALANFAAVVDVVTTEFENVPARTAEVLIACGATVRPGANALAIAQDRVLEKRFLNEAGVATTPYAAIESEGDLEAALQGLAPPAILKTRRLGYDGKGQAKITRADGAAAAWAAIGGKPAILEAMAPFEREISVVAARDDVGAFAAFDPAENTHEDGILRVSRVPSSLPQAILDDAVAATKRVADALDYVGVITVEFFVMHDGRLLANEIAPRVHNSGHWTEAVCPTSQFEQQVRAVAGWPLGSTARLAEAEMHNLIGDDVDLWPGLLSDRDVVLHLYGKRETRPGRKMGHFTRILR